MLQCIQNQELEGETTYSTKDGEYDDNKTLLLSTVFLF